MLNNYSKYGGCLSCPYLEDCKDLEGSGYTQQDEYGICPEDFEED